MSLVMVVTRNLPGRFEGFLVAQLLKVAPGVYVSPSLRARVREQLWYTLVGWSEYIPAPDGGLIMIYPDKEAPSGLALRTLGWPPKKIIEYDGLLLTVEAVSQRHRFVPEEHRVDDSLRFTQASKDPMPDMLPVLTTDEDSWEEEYQEYKEWLDGLEDL